MIMNKRLFLLALLAVLSLSAGAANDLYLWYNKPAASWNAALPLGNGRIAAMVYGNPVTEEFQLNEETISKGSPYTNYNPQTLQHLNHLRQLVFSGNSVEAQRLAETQLLAPWHKGSGAAYQTAGSLKVAFRHHRQYTSLVRKLCIDSALSVVTYKVGKTAYREEAFTSFKDQLLIVRYTASRRGKISFTSSLSYPKGQPVARSCKNQVLTMTGTSTAAADSVPGKVRFVVSAKVVNKGGSVSCTDTTLTVKGADEVTFYVAMATNFVNYNDISGDPVARVAAYMKASSKPYEQAKHEHIALYQQQFGRVKLNLGDNHFTKKPTDERIRDFSTATDNQLVALYFQFGRYLLISSSQPGCQPANLQGKWNENLNPAWKCRYTTNINTEMNYWPAEITNLSELHDPLFKMIEELSEAGAETARRMYGCRGWVAHHNTDLWRMTGAVDKVYSGAWPMSGAWLCQHLWTRWLYTGDKQFLSRAYPLLKGAATFFVDFLTTDPRNGYKVVCPSVSPENSPAPKRGTNLFAGVTMDNELLADLFSHTAAAATLLATDSLFADTLLTLRSQLMPLRIGQYGQLQEWADDWDSPKDHHRHVSHLWAFYPGTLISPYRTPAAYEAVKTSLIQRGDPSTGWSMGWKVCLWARCFDGNHAYQLIKNQLTLVPVDRLKGQDGGTYPNMFDAHPPFQIDGNFGCTAGIAEMMVQSHDGCVNLLPAIPQEWQEGEVSGLRTAGGFVIDQMTWRKGRLVSVSIRSSIGGNLRLRTTTPLVSATHVLKTAEGSNPNPLFDLYTMPVTRLQDGHYVAVDTVHAASVRSGEQLYDIDTKAGDVVKLTVAH